MTRSAPTSGTGPQTRHRLIDSPVGPLTLVVTDGGALAGLYTHEQAYFPAPAALGEPDDTIGQDTADQLAEYFAGERKVFKLPLAPRGTEFQQSVWKELCAIPHGQTRTYGELAASLGQPSAARAVGAATGRNPISIVIPCHRLVGASGSLTGYAGGIERKRWLLNHESAAR